MLTIPPRRYTRPDCEWTEASFRIGPDRCIFCDKAIDGVLPHELSCEGLRKALQAEAVEKAIKLLSGLGYKVESPKDSG